MLPDAGRTSVDNLQRKLNLPRGSCRLADHAKSCTLDDIGGQPHIDDIKQIKELRAELQIRSLQAISPVTNRSRLDERKIEIIICRAAKCITAERSKAPRVWSGPARDTNGNGKETCVVCAPPEIIGARSG